MQYAFVIKNFSPIFCKVEILHKEYGKISCMYSTDHQARLLTTGSLVVCDIEKVHYSYRLNAVEILTSAATEDMEHLEFIHQIALICMKLLPSATDVEDVFNFLVYVYQNIDNLDTTNRKIILLRLFFLCEIFDGTLDIYQIAMQDPFNKQLHNIQYIDKYVQLGFHKLFQEKNISF
jgi:hypothetical protein